MNTKAIRTILIIFQIIITVSILLADICGIFNVREVSQSRYLIESLVRSAATVAFTVFYYSSVSDSFGSDSLSFPVYLLFLSVSEARALESVEGIFNLYIIPQQYLVFLLLFSSFMLTFSLLNYVILPNASKKETNLFIIASLVASLLLSYYGPNAQFISETWNSPVLKSMFVIMSAIGIVASFIQFFSETLKSSRVKYLICILLLINNYINLVYNTLAMNTFGTVLYLISIVLIILLVKINSTRL